MDITAEELVDIFEERDVEPDEIFMPVAGMDWGFVAAWVLMSDKGWLVRAQCNNNGKTTTCFFADTVDDLAKWLIPNDLSRMDRLVTQANVLGVEYVAEVTEESTGPFCVLVSDYYDSYDGPIALTSCVFDERSREPLEFGTIAEAQKWIDKEKSGPYLLVRNETGRPVYKIVAREQ